MSGSPLFYAPPALIAPHVVGALVALALGAVALRTRPGSPTHRRAGIGYVAGWILLALMGALMGHRHANLSPFEVLNALGASAVALGYLPILMPAARRRLAGADGRGWLRWHLRFMVGSMPFLVVAGLNQTLPAVGVRYSMPLLVATTALSVVVTSQVANALLVRHRLIPGGARRAMTRRAPRAASVSAR